MHQRLRQSRDETLRIRQITASNKKTEQRVERKCVRHVTLGRIT